MKKQYNKPLWLDTCVFKNILGFDKNKTGKNGIKFEETYNRKKLEKYIKHHGYLMSEYSLYEVLRDSKWNSKEIVDKLNLLNSKSKQKLSSAKPQLKEFLYSMPEQDTINQYIHRIFINIIDFASDYYARILLFPILFNIYTFLYLFVQKNISYNKDLINYKIEKILQLLSTKIKNEFIKYQKYTKSVSEKVINKFFLIVNHWSIYIYNKEMLTLSNKYEQMNFNNAEEDIYQLLENLYKVFNEFNYNEEIVRCDNTKYANATDTIMFAISNLIMKGYKCSNEEWNKIFVQTIDKVLYSIYELNTKNVMDIYFRNNIHDIYTKVLNDRFKNKKIKELINGNDIIDLCGLTECVDNNFIFISTDSGINRVIDVIYNDKQKKIINLFINFKFTNSDNK